MPAMASYLPTTSPLTQPFAGKRAPTESVRGVSKLCAVPTESARGISKLHAVNCRSALACDGVVPADNVAADPTVRGQARSYRMGPRRIDALRRAYRIGPRHFELCAVHCRSALARDGVVPASNVADGPTRSRASALLQNGAKTYRKIRPRQIASVRGLSKL